jgi:hypothetical protein
MCDQKGSTISINGLELEDFMYIDNCEHSFEKLAKDILPGYLKDLITAINEPKSAEILSGPRYVNQKLLADLELKKDFVCCYVFIENEIPIYVGISRKVIGRILQHINMPNHNAASLAYRMAREKYPHKMSRTDSMKDPKFLEQFSFAQTRLRKMKVAYVEIENDLELYLFEVFASVSLKTSKWNTFRTH